MSRDRSVVVLDYGSGNVHSAAKALEAAGADVELTADRAKALDADGLVVPGVGAFRRSWRRCARRAATRSSTAGSPAAGRCSASASACRCCSSAASSAATTPRVSANGPATSTELDAPVLPHMGWNTVDAPADSVLFDGIRDERFYFVHSYAAQQWTLDVMPPFPPPRVTWASTAARFLAAVENGPLTATQFHPEKSGEAGIRLLAQLARATPLTATSDRRSR